MHDLRARPSPPPPAPAPPAAVARPCCSRPGEVRVLGSAVWWHGASGEWRVVPEELFVLDGGRVAWRRPAVPLACRPRVWTGANEVVFAPLPARGIVVAVRVTRVTPRRQAAMGPIVRGLTAERAQVDVRRGAREYFADAVEAALEIAIPPRLDAVVEF